MTLTIASPPDNPAQLSFDALLIGTLPDSIRTRITIDPVSGCWLWTGPLDRDGYGKLGSRGAHRVIYELLVGDVPPGRVLDHVVAAGCVSRACVNAFAHLEPVTQRENVMRGRSFAAINARKITCGTCGTSYDEANTYRPPGRPRRGCRRCNAASVRRYKRRQRDGGRLELAA